jgi:hypothetical protein
MKFNDEEYQTLAEKHSDGLSTPEEKIQLLMVHFRHLKELEKELESFEPEAQKRLRPHFNEVKKSIYLTCKAMNISINN